MIQDLVCCRSVRFGLFSLSINSYKTVCVCVYATVTNWNVNAHSPCARWLHCIFVWGKCDMLQSICALISWSNDLGLLQRLLLLMMRAATLEVDEDQGSSHQDDHQFTLISNKILDWNCKSSTMLMNFQNESLVIFYSSNNLDKMSIRHRGNLV